MKTNPDECPECYGTKQLVKMRPVQFGRPLPTPELCPACDGTGQRKKLEPSRDRIAARGDPSG